MSVLLKSNLDRGMQTSFSLKIMCVEWPSGFVHDSETRDPGSNPVTTYDFVNNVYKFTGY